MKVKPKSLLPSHPTNKNWTILDKRKNENKRLESQHESGNWNEWKVNLCNFENESEIKSLTFHWKGEIEFKTNFEETNSKDKIWTYKGEANICWNHLLLPGQSRLGWVVRGFNKLGWVCRAGRGVNKFISYFFTFLYFFLLKSLIFFSKSEIFTCCETHKLCYFDFPDCKPNPHLW